MATDGIYVGLIMGLFWLPTLSSVFMLLFMALATAMTKNALATLFYVWGLPTLALPFGLTMMLLMLNHKHLPRLIYIDITQLTVPEDHLHRFRSVRRVAKQLKSLLVSGQDKFYATCQMVEDTVAQVAERKLGLHAPVAMSTISVSRNNVVGILAECGVLSYAKDWQTLDMAHRSELDAWFNSVDADGSGFISLRDLARVVAEAVNAAQVQRTVNAFFDITGPTAAKGYLWHLEVSTLLMQAGVELCTADALRLYARADFVITKEDLAEALLPVQVSQASTSLTTLLDV
jgi:hypothetical protein